MIDHVKVDLMPNYDYEEFDRKQAEWESTNNQANNSETSSDSEDNIAW